MILDSVTLRCFRNIREATVDFDGGTTALIGENAQGKTNLLEGICFFACGKSFRVPHYRDMIMAKEKAATGSINVSGEYLPFELKFRLDRESGKEISKNGVKIEKLSQFLGLFRAVLFCPEHLTLIKDGPAKRRSFIDGAICQIRPYYASLLNEFFKTEAQRSALLKQSREKPVSRELLSVWEERLAAVSAKIAYLRADYVKRLEELAPAEYARLSGGRERFLVRYQSDVYREDMTPEEAAAQYRKTLFSSFEADRKYGYTQKGVHKDDLILSVDDFAARGYSSQGQQRSCVLALKMAEGEISRAMTGQNPVFLFDDVLSELDENRRRYITGGLAGRQVIFTGTDAEKFRFADKVIRVEKGRFSHEIVL